MSADSKIGIDVRQISWIRPLAGDYAFNFTQVAPLYAGDPQSPASWQGAIVRAQQHPRRRRDIARLVETQLERRGAAAAARSAAALLADDRTVAVVTGQQAGALGGPLYNLFKAISAIQLGRRLTAEHGVPVVPVFWVETEDHDWAEVRAATVLDANLEPRVVALPDPPGAGEAPVGSLTLDERVAASLEELRATLAPTDFSGWLHDTLRGAYAAGAGMGTAFATLLDAVLGPHGLVVFESSDAAVKPFVADLFVRELQFAGRTAALAAQAGAELQSRGHQPQVIPHPDSIALFHMQGGRRVIRRDGGAFVAGDERFTPEQLAATAVDHPERFSPNVLLRPVVQDAIFPTVCYVAGPSELAYLGQLRGVYEHFGVPMPLILPRATATLIDSASARFLAKYDLPVESLRPQDDGALNRLLEAQLPKEVEEALAHANEEVRRMLERIIAAVPAVDPTLAGAARTTLGRMEHDLRALHHKVIQAAKKRNETLRRQFARAQAQIFPQGHPQERTLAMVFFLNRYGPALVDRLLEDLPLEAGRHWLITM
ncbi:MAG TPA: bacillithiol biosynthesis cysteine-adding enzyme BshC [Vicinamibacterales bacterium]|nr:bacillithiol biosynthesis cysteine-adding enzyme BshC [Vicinamibacterales bacterium]